MRKKGLKFGQTCFGIMLMSLELRREKERRKIRREWVIIIYF